MSKLEESDALGPGIASLPTFDLHAAQVQAYARHKYLAHMGNQLNGKDFDRFEYVLLEHVTRINRLSDGLVAFETSGVTPELKFMTRPVLELLVSQLVLQYADVRDARGAILSPNEKAEMYQQHACFTKIDLAENHRAVVDNLLGKKEVDEALKKLQGQIDQKKYAFKKRKEWHQMSFADAWSEITAKVPIVFGSDEKGTQTYKSTKTPILDIDDSIHLMKEAMDKGIHGHASEVDFLRVSDDKASWIEDLRGPAHVNGEAYLNSTFAFYCAHLSVTHAAKHFMNEMKYKALLDQGAKELGDHPNRHQPIFPLSTVHLSTP